MDADDVRLPSVVRHVLLDVTCKLIENQHLENNEKLNQKCQSKKANGPIVHIAF